MRPAPSDSDLVHAWTAAATDPAIAAALESLYADIATQIEARGPVCRASGRCCNFEQAGHRLYTTGLETAYTLARLSTLPEQPAASGGDNGNGLVELTMTAAAPPRPATAPTTTLTSTALDDAIARGGCPFQIRNLCGVHPIRPLGCRVYFCDPSAQEWQRDLYERALAQLRELHDRFDIDYRYAEWRSLLRMFLNAAPSPTA